MTHASPKKRIVRSGFTLVETLVAIAILLVAIVGPMSIAQKGAQSAYYANEQMTAVFLAQEALEAVRKVRDDNGLLTLKYKTTGGADGTSNSEKWYADLVALSTCTTASGCDYNVNSETFSRDCSTSNECTLHESQGASDIVYGYDSSWPLSKYERKIVVGPLLPEGGHLLTVTVSWRTYIMGTGVGDTREVVLQTYLYDQYKYVP